MSLSIERSEPTRTEFAGIPSEMQLVGDEIPALAAGYHYSTALLRREERVQSLINEHYPLDRYGRKTHVPPAFWVECSDYQVEKGHQLIDVGIEDEHEALIGFGRVNDGLFCDFIVHTDHRRKGLGTAIILARFRLARKAGMNVMYTGCLEPTNDRLPVYTSLGFQQLADRKLFYDADGWSPIALYS